MNKQDLYYLIDQILSYVRECQNEQPWIDQQEALNLLGLRSRGALARLRNKGLIEYSKPSPKIIRYNRKSILNYIEKSRKKTF